MSDNRIILFAIAVLGALPWRSAAGAVEGEDATGRLSVLLGEYLNQPAAERRTELARQIRNTADESFEAVAKAMAGLALWETVPGGGRMVVPSVSDGEVGLPFQGFKDPRQLERRGLVLCLPAAPGLGEANLAVQRAGMVLGPTLYEHSFIVALEKPIAATFHQHPGAGDDLRKIMRELRRRFRLDTDRIFLFGYGEGGEGAWSMALSHPDFFAGALVVASHPRLPYPEQLAPLLLPNLRSLPVLSIYESDADPERNPHALPTAIYNRAMVQFGERHGLFLRGLETSFGATGTAKQPDDLPSYVNTERDVVAFAQRRRPPPGREVSHWFRYPSQGDLGWLRATKWHDEPWTGEQISIAPAAGADRDEFITAFFREKLFHLAGRVDGQNIAIETKGIARVEVLLYQGMVDLSRPVTVTVNGRQRHEEIVKPSIETLLEETYADWEFQRLVVARLAFSIADQP